MAWFFSIKTMTGWMSHEEPRVLKIHSISLYFTKLILGALLLFGGILGYMMIYNHGWEEKDVVESAVTTKVHGVTVDTATGRIWDNAEYIVPPKENGAFTVITSILETRQSPGTCNEDPSIDTALCTNDSDCHANHPVPYGNGVMTGQCSPINSNTSVCVVRAWCPVEIDKPSDRKRVANEDFTVEIRNHVKFLKFNENRQNFRDTMSEEDLRTCIYGKSHPHCPVFKVTTIVGEAGYTLEEMAEQGGVIEMVIKWDCTFGVTNFRNYECFPTYEFHRLDTGRKYTRGFHLRYADHDDTDSGARKRTLYRAYGIRVIVAVYGQGYKFDFFSFVKTFGSSLSYFGLVTFIISVIILKCFHRACGCCKCWGFEMWRKQNGTQTDGNGAQDTGTETQGEQNRVQDTATPQGTDGSRNQGAVDYDDLWCTCCPCFKPRHCPRTGESDDDHITINIVSCDTTKIRSCLKWCCNEQSVIDELTQPTTLLSPEKPDADNDG